MRYHTAKERKPAKNKLSSSPTPKTAPVSSRKRRRDAGKPARSHLSKLACLVLDKKVDKEVRLRQPLALTSVAEELQNQQQKEKQMDQDDEDDEQDGTEEQIKP